jgi:glycosyltransferase involved in cell wall biosynthesis
VKKVLSIVLNNFTHDSRVLKECLSLHKNGYDISVLALHDGREGLAETELISGVPVRRVRLVSKSWSKTPIVQVLKYLEFIIRAQSACRKADILHCNDLNALIVGVVAKILSLWRLKIVYDAHELECEAGARTRRGQKLLELAERLTILFANQVITVSPSIAEDYARRYGIKKPSLVLNAPAWREEIPQGDIFRKKFGIGQEQKIFIYQGGLSFERAVKELVEAFAARKKSDAVLIFMGYGPAEEYIRKASDKHHNIFLHPAVPPHEILQYTCGADYGLIFLHTKGNNNYYYCLPNKFFEYATCGLPFLANDLYDIDRMNEQYHLGELVKTMSVTEINEGIDKLLAEDYQQLSQNARQMAKNNSWEIQEKSLLNVYDKLTNLHL